VIGSEVVFGESRHLVTNGNGSTAEAAERRRHARMHVRGQALIRIARKTVSANLVNVSEGGMHCVVHDAESVLESGGRLESPLVLEDAGAESQVSLDVVANVSWHKAAGPGTQLGVVFTELADEQAEQLQRFLGNGGN
jgi:c-di-GMP-binding flagellar brake protein YcgR